MRDKLPLKIKNKECGIINLDNNDGVGTHWTAYVKNGNNIIYFDSFGNLKPPTETIKYFNSFRKRNTTKHIIIQYNHDNFQEYNTFNCGHLCLDFLYKYSKY